MISSQNTALAARAGSPFGAVAPRKIDGGRLDRMDQYVPSRRAETSVTGPSQPRPVPGPDLGAGSAIGAAAGAMPGFPLQVLLLGPPGSGKSTQAAALAERLGVVHISMGNLLREEMAAGTELGRAVSETVNGGELAPGDLVFQVLEKRLAADDVKNGFIIDGYPRELEQVPLLEDLCQRQGIANLQVVGLDVSDGEVQQRLAGRGRADDSAEVVANRLEIYHDQTSQVIDHFINEGRFWVVNGEGSVDEVAHRLEDCVSQWCPTPTT